MAIIETSDPTVGDEEVGHHLDYQYWYKEDGSRTSGPLPVDDYHTAKYVARGWSRKPPRTIDFHPDVEAE